MDGYFDTGTPHFDYVEVCQGCDLIYPISSLTDDNGIMLCDVCLNWDNKTTGV